MAQTSVPPETADVLDFLRANFARIDERFDRIDRVVGEQTVRLARIEREIGGIKMEIANLHGDYAMLHGRLDTLASRLQRIERRLDLVELPAAPTGRQ